MASIAELLLMASLCTAITYSDPDEIMLLCFCDNKMFQQIKSTAQDTMLSLF